MQLSYKLDKDETGQFTIYNLVGDVVSKYSLTAESGTLSISEKQLAAGMYFYNITVNGKTVKHDKFIIIK